MSGYFHQCGRRTLPRLTIPPTTQGKEVPFMKKLLSLLLALCMTASLTVAFAEAAPAEAPADNVVPLETETPAPAAEDTTAATTVTQHTLELDDQTLNYTATAGMMPVTVLDGTCDMFYTAYTLDGVEDMGHRPVTFVFNGGPGSASIWLHIGMLGPRRVEMDEDGQPLGLPSHVIDNPDTLLDLTDLVFIDPVGTGYSQVTGATDPSYFYNTNFDAASVAEFIHQYTTRNGRWGSPKYLAGESYGTVRAVAVAGYLADAYYMDLNGLMLISTANDYSLLINDTSDLSCVLYLPTYAAIAQYHGMLEEPYASMPLEDLIAEAKAFGVTEYQAALFRGIRLTDDEKDAMAEKIAALTGLKKDFVRKSNLRIPMSDFCTHLLEDKKQVCGRIDGRYTGPATNGNLGNSAADPSMAATSGMFASALNDYFYNELDYHTDLLYEALNTDVNASWTFGTDGYFIDQKQSIYTAMSRNRFLKIWVLCGYYDLATPFHCAEWVYDHVFLNEETRPNLSFTYYPSGHMIYMHQPSLDQFHEDAEAWYQK